MEFKPALIGSAETKKRGYVAFTGHKYGNQSYLLEIPASEAEPGEYGIFYMSIITAAGWLGKKTVEAVVGGGNKKKRRRSKTNWDRLSYSQKAWLHDHSL